MHGIGIGILDTGTVFRAHGVLGALRGNEMLFLPAFVYAARERPRKKSTAQDGRDRLVEVERRICPIGGRASPARTTMIRVHDGEKLEVPNAQT